MLHILLLILKIIGIVLASLIGLFLLLFAVVLFTPICYQGRAKYENTLDSLEVDAKITWLFRLISCSVSFQNKQLVWRVRAAFKRYPVPAEKVKPKKARKSAKVKKSVQADSKVPANQQTTTQTKVLPPPKAIEEQPLEPLEEPTIDTVPKKPRFQKIRMWYEKVKQFILNIKYTIMKIYDNMMMMLRKKDALIEFALKDTHKAALTKLKKELLRFLKYLKPKKIEIRGTFGFADPCITGQVLAGLSMLYPIIGNNAYITPDFEQPILEGSVLVKGKFRVIYFLIIGMRLLLDKNVRKTIKNVKNYKF